MVSNWTGERYVRLLTTCAYIYQGIVFILQFINSIRVNGDNLTIVVWEALKFSVWFAAALKLLIYVIFRESIEEVRRFISSSRVTSGDKDYDALQQRKFNQHARTMIRLIFGFMFATYLFLSIPNPATEMALGLPPELLVFGKGVTCFLYFFAVNFIPFAVYPRFLTNSTTFYTLLLGMRTKLNLLTHRYERILNQPILEASQYFNRMDRMLKEALEHHMQYWR